MNIHLQQTILQHANVISQQEPIVSPEGHLPEVLSKLLEDGQTFQGKVLDIRGQQAEIQVGSATFFAGLEEGTKLNIGEEVAFQVREHQEGKIVLKANADEAVQNRVFTKILQEASVPVTERNLTAVKEMMNYNMKVDKKAVQDMVRVLNANPQADVKTVVGLKVHEMKVTPENIMQYEKYQAANGKLTVAFDALFEEIREAVKEPSPKLMTALQEAVQLLEEGTVSEGKGVISLGEAEEGSGQLPLPEGGKEALKEMLKEPATQLSSQAKQCAEKLEKLFFLKPKMLESHGKEEVREYYSRLEKALDTLIQKQDTTHPRGEGIAAAAKEVQNNLTFMQELNQMSPYVQLPVKLGESKQAGELYILNRRQKKQADGEELTAFLHLTLEYLGVTDVRMSLKNKSLTTRFSLVDEQAVQLVSKHLDELKLNLEKAGYQVYFHVEEAKPALAPFEQILEADRPSQKIKRFAFDVRA